MGASAIAITDHGVVQAFPDAMSAAKDKIKVIYGVEGYYINDQDDRLCFSGLDDIPISSPFVAFDIETTGLDAHRDRITEIGAVIFENGEEKERFQTFVDPGRKRSGEITRLTGITDDDVRGAPSQEQAVKAFLEFAKGLPWRLTTPALIWDSCMRCVKNPASILILPAMIRCLWLRRSIRG